MSINHESDAPALQRGRQAREVTVTVARAAAAAAAAAAARSLTVLFQLTFTAILHALMNKSAGGGSIRMRSALARMRFAFSSGRKSLTLQAGPGGNDERRGGRGKIKQSGACAGARDEIHLTTDESAVFGHSSRN